MSESAVEETFWCSDIGWIAWTVLATSVIAGAVLTTSVIAWTVLATSVIAGAVLATSVIAGAVLTASVTAGAVLTTSVIAGAVLTTSVIAEAVLTASVIAAVTDVTAPCMMILAVFVDGIAVIVVVNGIAIVVVGVAVVNDDCVNCLVVSLILSVDEPIVIEVAVLGVVLTIEDFTGSAVVTSDS